MSLFGVVAHKILVGAASLVLLIQGGSHITATTHTQSAAPQQITSKTALKTETITKAPVGIRKIRASLPIQSRSLAVTHKALVLSASTTVAQTSIDPLQLNLQTRAAAVNILCLTRGGGDLNPITGSGVIVDSRGIVLTNAHVGQYFLLTDYPTPGSVHCVVRTGSPASREYDATLLYLPPKWIAQNASQIASLQPLGTGENDYSFLLINNPDGHQFSYLPMSTDVPNAGSLIFLAAYPAGFIQGLTILQDLYDSSAFSTVQELFSFTGGDAVDVFSMKGSVVAQPGSSGGPVVRPDNGKLIGIIATYTSAATTDARTLNAITVGHINRSMQADSLGGISSLFTGDVNATAQLFNDTVAPDLTLRLREKLKH